MDKIDFLQIPHKLHYPPVLRSKISTAHSNAISQFLSTYTGKYVERKQIIHILNCISYMYVSGDSLPMNWNIEHPCDNYIDIEDESILSDTLKDIYIENEKAVRWAETDKYKNTSESIKIAEQSVTSIEPKILDLQPQSSGVVELSTDTESIQLVSAIVPLQSAETTVENNKSDLYIQSPTVPQFDTKQPWMSKIIDNVQYVIYKSLPIIPTKQNEISITTDVDVMLKDDLLALFPSSTIQTRAAIMYEPQIGMELDPLLGLIFPIDGFSTEQVRENIIKYPHLFRLLKQIDREYKSFYSTIEIDGELHKITDIWSSLPESSVIPYNKDFIKEYVVRRYLLERDILHVDHRYSMYGTLDPFLTLFTTPEIYSQLGYSDSCELARQCVRARVSYKQSRNPIVRRLMDA